MTLKQNEKHPKRLRKLYMALDPEKMVMKQLGKARGRTIICCESHPVLKSRTIINQMQACCDNTTSNAIRKAMVSADTAATLRILDFQPST